eukprot:gnl/TRDRNA2_/TRDRNA2_177167_c1_seq1.p1 gnl/TRDRNA2_/TRDRNA2_177167_c1~~gnl/TRDRNA2_/TRDRNA2_177167_c1_seq1.p1  ORF type:complete len:506 (+),score=-16.82 gnl/TRDRNA2_/TRDRNA2_177167_c1_seq1:200-1717(+)
MLIDDLGEVTVTNDGATILKRLEVQHPAAMILVELAELQDNEIGDGTTSVVILASELLRKGNLLIRKNLHPTTIITGYRHAMKKGSKYVDTHLAIPIDQLGERCLLNCAKTSMNSKIIGLADNLFPKMVVDTILTIKKNQLDEKLKISLEDISTVKNIGQKSKESQLVNGCAIKSSRAAPGMPSLVKNAKIACLDFDFRKSKLQSGIQVIITDPIELETVREREATITKERIKKILDTGANVILTTKGIDDMAMKYFTEANAIACRRVSKEDLCRIAKATGAKIVLDLADDEGCESFDKSMLGSAGLVHEERMCECEILFFTKCCTPSATLVLQGSNEYAVDEIERSVRDGLSVVKKIFECGTVVSGGGATETSLAVFLENYAHRLVTKEQLAFTYFSEALLILPKILLVNASKDAIELVAKLRAFHYVSQLKNIKRNTRELSQFGFDLNRGTIRNNLDAGVIEPTISKTKALQFATEATITILRIDDFIKITNSNTHKIDKFQR